MSFKEVEDIESTRLTHALKNNNRELRKCKVV